MKRVVILMMVLAGLSIVTTAAATQAARGQAGQPDVNGFKLGDTVQVDTAFGWTDAVVVAAAGNNYQVRTQQGVVVSKTYPTELHRKGAFTDRDHAVGLYDMKDRVQVNIQGQGWVEGHVITRRGLEYEVQFPGNKSAWASGTNIRYVGAPVVSTAKAGAPPKPGFVSCAGKIEGRYAPSNGMAGLTIIFKAGKATVTALMGEDEVLECWTSGTKIILRDPKNPDQDLPIDINKDGTLETPLGELKKKGD